MMYKKTIVVWADAESELLDACERAVDAARQYTVAAHGVGRKTYAIENPAADPDYNETVAEMFEEQSC